MTNREFITMALENITTNEEFTAKGKEMINALDKRKASGSGKKAPSKETKINTVVKDFILEVLGNAEKPMAIADIIKALPTEVEYTKADGTVEVVPQTYTSNRVSSLMVALRKDNKVKRTYDKKTALFELGSENEVEGE